MYFTCGGLGGGLLFSFELPKEKRQQKVGRREEKEIWAQSQSAENLKCFCLQTSQSLSLNCKTLDKHIGKK